MLYQIKDWDKHYENNKSRERELLRWCSMPNKQDGLGYRRLLSMKNGEAAYGCFVATVLAASKARNRNGWLTDDGTESGVPWDANAISLKTGFSKKTADNMLEYCTLQEVGWITGTQVPAECPPSARQVPMEGKGRKGKELDGKKDSSDRSETGSEPPHRRVAFDYSSGQFTGLTDGDYAVWHEAYPAVDQKAEVQKARAWLLANPTKRKKNVYGFLTRWMASQQERSGRREQYAQASKPSVTNAPMWKRSLEATYKAINGVDVELYESKAKQMHPTIPADQLLAMMDKAVNRLAFQKQFDKFYVPSPQDIANEITNLKKLAAM